MVLSCPTWKMRVGHRSWPLELEVIISVTVATWISTFLRVKTRKMHRKYHLSMCDVMSVLVYRKVRKTCGRRFFLFTWQRNVTILKPSKQTFKPQNSQATVWSSQWRLTLLTRASFTGPKSLRRCFNIWRCCAGIPKVAYLLIFTKRRNKLRKWAFNLCKRRTRKGCNIVKYWWYTGIRLLYPHFQSMVEQKYRHLFLCQAYFLPLRHHPAANC